MPERNFEDELLCTVARLSCGITLRTSSDATKPLPPNVQEVDGTITLTGAVPELFLCLEHPARDDRAKIDRGMVALRGRGLITVATKRLTLHGKETRYLRGDGTEWLLTKYRDDAGDAIVAFREYHQGRMGDMVTIDSATVMPHYQLTATGWTFADSIRRNGDTVESAQSHTVQPVDGQSCDAVPGQSHNNALADDAYLAPRDFAKRYGGTADAWRKRLETFRRTHLDCYKEISESERGPHDPKYLYRVGAVWEVVEKTRRPSTG